MWNYLYELWRSVLRRGPRGECLDPGASDPFRDALREELRRLLEERSTLQKTVASYEEFGYDHLADQVRRQITDTDRRIVELRHQLRRGQTAPGR